ncbi:MAG: Acg family FMN-binding oxidoreductase [Streptosporangiaceae bacterium]|jgi:nitroreductase
MPASLTDNMVRRLIEAAAAAPSIHNTQPWRFRVCGDVIEMHGDPSRILWVADPLGRALHLSCGAALFNLRLAIRLAGARPLIWPLPDPAGEPTLLASVQLTDGRAPTPQEREMAEAIQQRHSSRAPFSGRPLPEPVQIGLEQEAGYEFAVLRMLSPRDAALVLQLAGAAEARLATDFDHRVELAEWVGTTGEDGIPASALGSRPDRQPAPVRDLGYAAPNAVRPEGSFERQPQLGVLSTARDEPGDWLRAGQALQRVLLAATRHGVATSLLYQPIELGDMEHREGSWWPWPECPQIIIRFGYGPRGADTPRRPVAAILDQAEEAAH